MEFVVVFRSGIMQRRHFKGLAGLADAREIVKTLCAGDAHREREVAQALASHDVEDWHAYPQEVRAAEFSTKVELSEREAANVPGDLFRHNSNVEVHVSGPLLQQFMTLDLEVAWDVPDTLSNSVRKKGLISFFYNSPDRTVLLNAWVQSGCPLTWNGEAGSEYLPPDQERQDFYNLSCERDLSIWAAGSPYKSPGRPVTGSFRFSTHFFVLPLAKETRWFSQPENVPTAPGLVLYRCDALAAVEGNDDIWQADVNSWCNPYRDETGGRDG